MMSTRAIEPSRGCALCEAEAQRGARAQTGTAPAQVYHLGEVLLAQQARVEGGHLHMLVPMCPGRHDPC